jgi:peptidoglycan hydrolase-like protein with peptidoglycan-binding domain
MRSFMRRLSAGVLGLVAVATTATLVSAAPAGAAVGSTAAQTHAWSTSLHWPAVGRGAAGERVITIQYLLQHRGFHVRATGFYGRVTARDVRAFQHRRGLRATGVVTAPTWNRLIVTLSRGSTGSPVRAWQHSMRHAYGFRFQRVNGVFGPQTLRVTLAFQRGSRLAVTGVVGHRTWKTAVVFER